MGVPCTKIFFVIFTIGSSWAMLSVMTGVVSDHMMSVRENQAKNDDEKAQREVRVERQLRGVFAAADKDSSGSLGRIEYMELLQSPYHVAQLRKLASGISAQDMAAMFDWLDIDGDGELQFTEFLHGFHWLNEAITGKSLLKIEREALLQCHTLKRAITSLRSDVERLSSRHDARNDEISAELQRTLEAKQHVRETTLRAAEARREADSAKAELQNLRGNFDM